MKRQILTLLLAALALAVPAKAEWFDQGKVAYRTPNDKWRPAAILVESGKIEIYNRKDRGLVAEFTKADSVEHKIQRRRRWRESHAFGAALVGGYIFEFAKARAYQGNVGITRDGEVFERTIDRKRLGITLGVLGGIAAAVALTKAKEPYTEITSGDQTIRLRVNRDDLVRFEHSLKPFVETDRQGESGTPGKLSYHEVAAISHFR